ncbi:Transposase DDE domain protein [Streptomyces cyanogenus]|uniref:Transposase DDE domain protein n=1 Tax=Streptomyces cyanogenus TaxID=80860 RepID=A0ABX7THC4_STRCY|nr:Transposase DDE domain protein [Streptomyces cyanogenus]
MITDRHGTPLAVSVTSENRHDVTQLMPLLDAIPRIRGLVGRPRHRPRRLFADRGYDYDKYRRLTVLAASRRRSHAKSTAQGSGLGRTRWVVERTFAWLHQFKGLRSATRYEPTSTSESLSRVNCPALAEPGATRGRRPEHEADQGRRHRGTRARRLDAAAADDATAFALQEAPAERWTPRRGRVRFPRRRAVRRVRRGGRRPGGAGRVRCRSPAALGLGLGGPGEGQPGGQGGAVAGG